MSLKAKLATTIAALCMVICLLSVGVWAATTATVTLKGTVNFVAKDVSVTVSGVAKGTTPATTQDGQPTERPISTLAAATWSADKEPAEAVVWNDGEEESGIDLTFDNKNEVITVVITVANNNTQRHVDVAFAPTLTFESTEVPLTSTETLIKGANLYAKYERTDTNEQIDKATVTEGETPVVTPTTATYTITLRIADKNNAVNSVVLDGTMTISDPSEAKTEG